MPATMARKQTKNDGTKASDEMHARQVRMPYRLWKGLERVAKEESRSINGQIEHLVKQFLKTRFGETEE